MSAIWGLLPLPFLAGGLILAPRIFATVTTANFDGRLFGFLILNNMAYLATLAILAFLLCRPGTPGENRYGEQPT